MNNQSMTLFRTLFLILAAVSFLTIGTQPTSVFADGEETPPSQESARESVASCDNITYKVPPVPVDVEGSEHFAIPPNSEGPVLADIGLYIEEIPEVNEIDNTFTVEGLMNIVWCDPRLKYEDRGQGEFEILLEEDVREKFSVIWWPDITFANEVEGRDIADEELVIHENGTLEYREKFTVVLEAIYDLSKFPFDEQTLEIEIESFAWDEGSLQLHINEKFSGFSDRFQIPEWRWQEDNVTTRIEDRMEKGDRTPFSEFLMSIHITRQSGFYIWKVLFPLVILVSMCFAVFWMDEEGLSSRLPVSFTGVLTVVAYQFIATGSLPKIPYVTLMDTYITVSFVVMILTIFQSLIVSSMKKRNRNELALKMDVLSRRIFPLVYLLAMGAATLLFLV